LSTDGMISFLGHKLHSPLAVILSQCEMLLTLETLDESAARKVKHILTNAQTLRAATMRVLQVLEAEWQTASERTNMRDVVGYLGERFSAEIAFVEGPLWADCGRSTIDGLAMLFDGFQSVNKADRTRVNLDEDEGDVRLHIQCGTPDKSSQTDLAAWLKDHHPAGLTSLDWLAAQRVLEHSGARVTWYGQPLEHVLCEVRWVLEA